MGTSYRYCLGMTECPYASTALPIPSVYLCPFHQVQHLPPTTGHITTPVHLNIVRGTHTTSSSGLRKMEQLHTVRGLVTGSSRRWEERGTCGQTQAGMICARSHIARLGTPRTGQGSYEETIYL